MMRRLVLACALLLVGCGTSQPPVTFACGDGGPTCQSATQFCDIVSKTGVTPSVTASCKDFTASCHLCDCLVDAGIVGSCLGSVTCTPNDNGTITVNESCIQ